jgi:methyltransferase
VRYWAIRTLGASWNARAVVDPARGFVARGPYRFVRHPNYLAMLVECLSIPLVLGAWRSALVLNLLHAWVLARRIRAEERLLFALPGYAETMGTKGRLLPRWKRRA